MYHLCDHSECDAKISYFFPAVWCRRTDELVDGPNASHITPKALDRWEKRLDDLFGGRPYDMYDAALADTVSKYPVDIQVRTNPSTPCFFCLYRAIGVVTC